MLCNSLFRCSGITVLDISIGFPYWTSYYVPSTKGVVWGLLHLCCWLISLHCHVRITPYNGTDDFLPLLIMNLWPILQYQWGREECRWHFTNYVLALRLIKPCQYILLPFQLYLKTWLDNPMIQIMIPFLGLYPISHNFLSLMISIAFLNLFLSLSLR